MFSEIDVIYEIADDICFRECFYKRNYKGVMLLMLKYLGKRIARSFLTLIIILTVVFCLLRLMPIEGYFTNFDKLTSQQIQVSLQEMGLTDPLPVQVVRFFNDLVHGDLGVSRIYRANVPVAEILADKVPVSIKLGVLSMIVSLFVGLPMGALMARYKIGRAHV